jgi:hypothetical protein
MRFSTLDPFLVHGSDPLQAAYACKQKQVTLSLEWLLGGPGEGRCSGRWKQTDECSTSNSIRGVDSLIQDDLLWNGILLWRALRSLSPPCRPVPFLPVCLHRRSLPPWPLSRAGSVAKSTADCSRSQATTAFEPSPSQSRLQREAIAGVVPSPNQAVLSGWDEMRGEPVGCWAGSGAWWLDSGSALSFAAVRGRCTGESWEEEKIQSRQTQG